ncbi:MAG: hypothetical protein AABZ39_04920 [Spirochaetota bacterium]
MHANNSPWDDDDDDQTQWPEYVRQDEYPEDDRDEGYEGIPDDVSDRL